MNELRRDNEEMKAGRGSEAEKGEWTEVQERERHWYSTVWERQMNKKTTKKAHSIIKRYSVFVCIKYPDDLLHLLKCAVIRPD